MLICKSCRSDWNGTELQFKGENLAMFVWREDTGLPGAASGYVEETSCPSPTRPHCEFIQQQASSSMT